MSVPLRQASREILGKSRRYRFWKTVGVQPAAGNTFQVFLDKKPVKTSTGTVLEVDKEEHALLMASEWQKGISSFNHHSLPITSLLARRQEFLLEKGSLRQKAMQDLLCYLDTDTILYHANRPDKLVSKQQKHWVPLLHKLQDKFQIRLMTTTSLGQIQQPQQTLETLKSEVEKFDDVSFACFEMMVINTKSFLIAFALVSRLLSVRDALTCARLEYLCQEDMWGSLPEAHGLDEQFMLKQVTAACALLPALKESL